MISTSRIALLIRLAFVAVLIVFWLHQYLKTLATTTSQVTGPPWTCQISGI